MEDYSPESDSGFGAFFWITLLGATDRKKERAEGWRWVSLKFQSPVNVILTPLLSRRDEESRLCVGIKRIEWNSDAQDRSFSRQKSAGSG